MNFQSIIDQTQNCSFEQLTIPSSWTQGRTSYGGLVAAMILSAMKQKIEQDRPLRTLNISFIGPLQADTPFGIEIEVLREGKSLSQLQGRAVQNSGVCAQVQAVFGKAIKSALDINEFIAPKIPSPDQGTPFPYIKGLTPDFIQHMDTILCIGDLPCTGSKSQQLGGWMRFKSPAEKLDDISHIGLIDAWPPATLPMLNTLSTASTATWNLELINPLPLLKADTYLAYQANIEQTKDGYGFTKASIWSPKGELIALSHQMVIVYG